MTKARILSAAMLLLLAACNKQPDKQVQAGGEILPGSASDAMLPVDAVTSQPPLAPRTEKGPGAAESESAAGDVAAPVDSPAEPASPQG